MSVKVPSDVDLEDRILWGLTGRQLLILCVAGTMAWAVYLPLGRWPYAGAAAAALVLAVGLVVAVARPDGLPAERWVGEAFRHLSVPRRRVLAPEGVSPFTKRGDVAPLVLPLESIGDDGIVSLGRSGYSLVCRASSVNLSLRSPRERAALVDGFGRFLNSIDAGLSFVVRAEPNDVRRHVQEIEARAASLPHPALEAAARAHARYLENLAARRDVLRREVYVVFAEGSKSNEDARRRLLARADEAAVVLRGLGVQLTVLDGQRAQAVVERALDPEVLAMEGDVGLSGSVVTGDAG